MDLSVGTNSFPSQGETVLGEFFKTVPGGKGANQAVAASRLGSDVRMIGCLGNDPFGDSLLRNLKGEGVSVEMIAQTETTTGIAAILLHDGDNRIIVVTGANSSVSPQLIDKHWETIKASRLVVLQLEIPSDTIEYTLHKCHESGIPVLLNPAPAANFKKEWMSYASYITPNETECESIFGSDYKETLQLYPNKLIVTLGSKGACYHDGETLIHIDGYKTDAVDTTGAGDTFNGALAHALVNGYTLQDAIHFANIAASLSVEKFGAQGGMPTFPEVENRLKNSSRKEL